MVVSGDPFDEVMVKIIDFGVSLKAHIEAARNREKVDTPTWLAPVPKHVAPSTFPFSFLLTP